MENFVKFLLSTLLKILVIPVILIILALGGILISSLINTASTPGKIARKVGVKLPAYEVVDRDDNMDRGASSWSSYRFEVKFKEPLSESYLRKLEGRKHCTREGDTYTVSRGSDSWHGTVTFYPKKDMAVLVYEYEDFLF